MLQLVQNLKTGTTSLEEVPAPRPLTGTVLIRTTCSLVSPGTERMLVEFGKASLVAKARQQPDKVKMVLDKIKSDGLMPTLEAVFNKLDQPLPLGYCNVGEVVEVGAGVTGFSVGDRVASNGPHAELVCVPKNLVAHIPDDVSNEAAVFTVIGSIGLQGIRLLKPELGETVIVIGLGLIGLITAELLQSNGCRVIGVDIDEHKLSLAESKGITTVNSTTQDVVKLVQGFTNNIGADGVIVTASAKSSQIISQAAQMSRKRGRIILVGVVGLELNRAEFYEKELTFQVSCSYGPGRYDPQYEQSGLDYPLPFVRWTEKRNFKAILSALSKGQLQVDPFVTQKVPLADYQMVYDNLNQSGAIASLLSYTYKQDSEVVPASIVKLSEPKYEPNEVVAGIIGAGNFTKMTLLPALKSVNASIKSIASARGLNAASLARKFRIPQATSDYQNILNDCDVNLVIITTRHNLHAPMVIEALSAGKHVFVEKPLALNTDQLKDIINTLQNSPDLCINVGFNRRFAPLVQKLKNMLGESPKPMNLVINMNAGHIPPDSWIQDIELGGGRIIGEACHHIDLASYLCRSKVHSVCMNALGPVPSANTDNASIMLKYENGSNVVVNYFSNGHKRYSKERVEVYFEGKTIVLDNFRRLYTYGFKSPKRISRHQNKGHEEQFDKLIQGTEKGSGQLIPKSSLINTSLTSIKAIESLQVGSWVEVKL